jgi:anti-anti-sigma factor
VTVLNDVVLSPAANATDYKPSTGPLDSCSDASTSAREAFLRVRVSDDFKPSTYVAVYLDNGTQLIVRDSELRRFHSAAPRAARLPVVRSRDLEGETVPALSARPPVSVGGTDAIAFDETDDWRCVAPFLWISDGTSDREWRVVRLHGEIDGTTSKALETELFPYARSDANLVVDLSDVTLIDSAGIRVLQKLSDELRARSRSIRLENPSSAVRRILDAVVPALDTGE